LLLKAYDTIVVDSGDDPPIWWARHDAAQLRSQSRKQAMQYWHLPEYWGKHGFPPHLPDATVGYLPHEDQGEFPRCADGGL
jgi:hypothetical protein